MNKSFLTFLFCFVLATSFVCAQKNKVSLSELLKIYEEKFQVKFTLDSKNIDGLFVRKNKEVSSVEEAILFMQGETELVFKVLSKRYISIIPQKKRIEYLAPVTVTYLTPGLEKNKDGSIALNTKEFGILPGLTQTDIMQTIQVIPGVESENDDINYLNIRGGTNDQNLVLFDGIKMYHYSHFFGLISAYDANLIDKVVVTKNGTSSQYGDGISSTINLIAKNKLSTKLTGGIGSDFLATSAYLEVPISKKITVQLSGRKSINETINSITYHNYYQKTFQDSEIETSRKIAGVNYHSEFNFHDYSLRFLYDINAKNKIRFNFINIQNQLLYSENLEGSTRKNSALDQEKTALGLNWEYQWNSTFTSKLNVYRTNYTINSSDEKRSLGQAIEQKNNIIENAIKLTNEWVLTPKTKLLFGGQVFETGILNATTVSIPSLKRSKKRVLVESALFSELEISKLKNYIKGGLRLNVLNKWGLVLLEPRFIFKRKIDRNLKLKFLAESKHQTVNQTVDFKDNFLKIENRRWVLSNNQDVPVIKSQQYSYGLEYSKKGFYSELTAFYKKVKGITALSQGFYNNFQFNNAAGTYKVLGTEFLVNKRTEKYSAWMGYIVSNNNYTFPSFSPKHFRNNVHVEHSANLGGNVYATKKFTLSLGLNWKTGNLYTKPVFGKEIITIKGLKQVNYDEPNGENLPNYFRLDASAKYNFNLTKNVAGVASIGVLNLTNKKNVIKKYYILDDDDELVETNNYSLRLTPNASLRFLF